MKIIAWSISQWIFEKSGIFLKPKCTNQNVGKWHSGYWLYCILLYMPLEAAKIGWSSTAKLATIQNNQKPEYYVPSIRYFVFSKVFRCGLLKNSWPSPIDFFHSGFKTYAFFNVYKMLNSPAIRSKWDRIERGLNSQLHHYENSRNLSIFSAFSYKWRQRRNFFKEQKKSVTYYMDFLFETREYLS